MVVALVLHGRCDIVSAYPSEDVARARHDCRGPGSARARVTNTGAHPKAEADTDFVLLRAAEAASGGALTAPNICYNASLLRTAAQKLVRRQQGVEAATVVMQYLRQLASPGAKGVNEERKTILERMIVVAAEDAGVVSSLSIGIFHILGATSPEIGFGARDADAVASCFGALALAPRPEGEKLKKHELPSEPDESNCEPAAWAMSLALRLMAERKTNPERRWLQQLEGKFRAQGLAPPPPHVAPLKLKPTEPLPPRCQPHFAVDHHDRSKDQKKRRSALFAALRSAVQLPAGKSLSDEELEEVIRPYALLNLRDGVCRPQAAGSWEAQVMAAWPHASAKFWKPAQAAAQPKAKRSAGDEGTSTQPQKKQACQTTLAFAPASN